MSVFCLLDFLLLLLFTIIYLFGSVCITLNVTFFYQCEIVNLYNNNNNFLNKKYYVVHHITKYEFIKFNYIPFKSEFKEKKNTHKNSFLKKKNFFFFFKPNNYL